MYAPGGAGVWKMTDDARPNDAVGVASPIEDLLLSSGSACAGKEFARLRRAGAGVAIQAPGGLGVAIDDQFGRISCGLSAMGVSGCFEGMPLLFAGVDGGSRASETSTDRWSGVP